MATEFKTYVLSVFCPDCRAEGTTKKFVRILKGLPEDREYSLVKDAGKKECEHVRRRHQAEMDLYYAALMPQD